MTNFFLGRRCDNLRNLKTLIPFNKILYLEIINETYEETHLKIYLSDGISFELLCSTENYSIYLNWIDRL